MITFCISLYNKLRNVYDYYLGHLAVKTLTNKISDPDMAPKRSIYRSKPSSWKMSRHGNGKSKHYKPKFLSVSYLAPVIKRQKSDYLFYLCHVDQRLPSIYSGYTCLISLISVTDTGPITFCTATYYQPRIYQQQRTGH